MRPLLSEPEALAAVSTLTLDALQDRLDRRPRPSQHHFPLDALPPRLRHHPGPAPRRRDRLHPHGPPLHHRRRHPRLGPDHARRHRAGREGPHLGAVRRPGPAARPRARQGALPAPAPALGRRRAGRRDPLEQNARPRRQAARGLALRVEEGGRRRPRQRHQGPRPGHRPALPPARPLGRERQPGQGARVAPPAPQARRHQHAPRALPRDVRPALGRLLQQGRGGQGGQPRHGGQGLGDARRPGVGPPPGLLRVPDRPRDGVRHRLCIARRQRRLHAGVAAPEHLQGALDPPRDDPRPRQLDLAARPPARAVRPHAGRRTGVARAPAVARADGPQRRVQRVRQDGARRGRLRPGGGCRLGRHPPRRRARRHVRARERARGASARCRCAHAAPARRVQGRPDPARRARPPRHPRHARPAGSRPDRARSVRLCPERQGRRERRCRRPEEGLPHPRAPVRGDQERGAQGSRGRGHRRHRRRCGQGCERRQAGAFPSSSLTSSSSSSSFCLFLLGL